MTAFKRSETVTASTSLVTTDTAQDITGVKTFPNGMKGRTDGGTPSTGYIGEVTRATGGGVATGSMLTGGGVATVCSITLNKGVYLVQGVASLNGGGSTVMGSAKYVAASIGTSATGFADSTTNVIKIDDMGSSGYITNVTTSDTIVITADNTVVRLGAWHGLTTIGGAFYRSTSVSYPSTLVATRIA